MQLYQSDEKLPATGVLFDTSALAALIGPWIGGEENGLSIVNIRYKPATSCVVSYRLNCGDDQIPIHIKAFSREDWLIRKAKIVRESPGALIDDEYAFAVYRFPDDAQLPAIRKFVNDPYKFLARVLFEKQIVEETVDFEILAYKPNRRCSIRIKFGSGRNIVLKLHDDSTFRRVLASAAVLKKSLPVQLPERIGRSNRFRSLAYDWIDGAPVDFSILETNRAGECMELIFEYVNRLHIPLTNSRSKLPDHSPGKGITAIANYIAEICPPLGIAARQISQDICAELKPGSNPTLIHGDFHEQQLLLTTDGVRACDFDDCGIGNPGSDLANLVGHLYYRAYANQMPLDRVESIDEQTMSHLSCGNRSQKQATVRYQWHRIAAIFRLATHPFRSGDSEWIERTRTIMGALTEQISKLKASSFAVLKPTGTIVGNSRSSETVERTIETRSAAESITDDASFEFLADALKPARAGLMLQQHVPELAELYGDFEVEKIIPRRHKSGRRCLIEFQLTTGVGSRSILGKSSARRLDRKAYHAQRDLYEQYGFDLRNANGVQLARPLGYCSNWNMWFQERVDAIPGIGFLDRQRLSSVTGRIATALAALHSSDFVPSKTHTLADELRILNERLQLVCEVEPCVAGRIRDIVEQCRSIAYSFRDTPAVPIHRDFYHDQIMFSEHVTYLVDLDLISLGHPAIDVGNFLAHLTEHGIREFNDRDYWIDEENAIASQYMGLMPDVTRAEIAAGKAISLARHISISSMRSDRRFATGEIIAATEQITNHLVYQRSS